MKKNNIRYTLLVLLGFCILAGITKLYAKQITAAAILSSDNTMFKQALDGFQSSINKEGVDLKLTEYNIKGSESANVFSQINANKPDIILTIGEEAARKTKDNISGIPIIMCAIFNSADYADSNCVGVTFDIPSQIKLQGIKKILPNVKKIGVIYSQSSMRSFDEISKECGNLGFQAIGKKIETEKDFSAALDEVCSQSDCFLMVFDTKIYYSQTVKFLIFESLKRKIPVIGLSSTYTKAGALVSFDCDFDDLGRQAGAMAVKIANGEKINAMRPGFPKIIKYSINMITADKIGVNIPGNALKDASDIIK